MPMYETENSLDEKTKDMSGQFAGVAILYLPTICSALIILRISDIFLPISRRFYSSMHH